MALAAAVYLSVLGPQGLKECSTLNFRNAHDACEAITKVEGFLKVFSAPFFNEFVVRSKIDPQKLNQALLQEGIVGGLSLEPFYPELKGCMLFCATEMNSKGEIDRLARVLRKNH